MTPIKPNIHYHIKIKNPQLHLFDITLTIDNWQKENLDLKMPVWTPGSYLVREYSQHLQDFTATKSDQQTLLTWRKNAKNYWQIETKSENKITVQYKIYANELTVRTNHLDATHGYFNGAGLFFYIPEYEDIQYQVSIDTAPLPWHITTALKSVDEHTFIADDFDQLVDSPFEIGEQKIEYFQVLNKPHQWVTWGKGNIDTNKIIKDTKKIIEIETKIFGELPYDNYFFLLHLSGSGFGGLEHKDCCVLNYPRFGFQKKEKYDRFIQLVAHEFFHLWNVKRIRPKALETFDYDQENYTSSLWFCEGATSFYDIFIPYRAKIYDRLTLFSLLNKDITQYLNTPGRKVQPLRESSFDAWIKLYRRTPYSNNNQISYYLKGQFICFLLDLLIRKNSENKHSFDNVMGQMWQQFGKPEVGYTENELKNVIEDFAQEDLSKFWELYLDGTEELPFDEYLEPFGLMIEEKIEKKAPPTLGIIVQREGTTEKITFVDATSPAGIAGLQAGDELLAVDGFRVTGENLMERLQDYQPEDTIELTVFHEDELLTTKIKLATPQPSAYKLKTIPKMSALQQQRLEGWLK
ncbi:MAG: M61 family metallopeptidase [Cyanobacterium sp. T60_A2020_053]|nr:M61 family metallopeptidase [Cyanobacterium sp. T60_A2020_053]